MSRGRIHIRTPKGLEVWTWRSARSGVEIRDPDRKKYFADYPTVSRTRWDDAVATPAVVRKYIENVIKRGKHQKKRTRADRGGPKDWFPGGVPPGRFLTK